LLVTDYVQYTLLIPRFAKVTGFCVGFDVKTEYEKSSNTIRIQGIENKEAMKSAAVPNESIDSEMRVVVMEGKLSPDDFLDESDDDIMAEMSNNSNEVDQHQQQGMISNLDGVVSRIISGDATSNNVSFVPGETTEMKGESEVLLTGHQQFHQQQQSQQFEIATATSTGSDSNSQEVYYIGIKSYG
jgi:protein involved in temperature-dependent protein secretion